jgi:short-subunit dehydrogenase
MSAAVKLVSVIASVWGLRLAVRSLRPSSTYNFRGKSVVITGASRGLGLVLARLFAVEGARLTILARDTADLRRAERDLTARRAEVFAIPSDVRNQQEVNNAVKRIIDRYDRIDVIINNAGVIQTGPVEHMGVEDFENAMAVHFRGPMYMTLAVAPHMRRQGGGRIVNISSIGGLVSIPHLVAYCTSKFALVGFSDGMRAELAKDNIFVTTVCPGLMRTGGHFNSLFNGQHQREFAWFSLFDALPFTSTSAENAARQIVEACRRGAPQLIITPQARVLAYVSGLFPGFTAWMMKLFNRFLPAPTDEQGDETKVGWESQSSLAPSFLTRLADRAAEENNNLRGHPPVV